MIMIGDDWGGSEGEILERFEEKPETLAPYEVLIGGFWSYSYEGYAWFLLRNRETKELFEVNASHCSCYGFEGTFEPSPTSVKYLLSEQFYMTHAADKEERAKIRAVVEGLSA